MPGRKRVREENPDDYQYEENVKRLRSRTIQIWIQVGKQHNVHYPIKVDSEKAKEFADSSIPPASAEIANCTGHSSDTACYKNSCSTSIKGKQDPHRLLSILPEELWILVVEKVEDPNDLENLSNSSLYFRNLLLSQRVNFLFQNVWKVLANKNEGETLVAGFRGFPWTWDYGDGERIPSENRNWLKQLLTVRLVCRSWCNGVDFYYQNHPLHLKLQEEPRNNRDADSFLRPLLQDTFSTMNVHPSNHFLRRFSTTHDKTAAAKRSPFFGRRVLFRWQTEDPQVVSEKVFSVLLNYGHHIWYCTLHVTGRSYYIGANEVNLGLEYRTIRQIIALMPNLKVLELKYNVVGKLTNEEQNELQNEIELNPFPTFKNLELLSTTYLFTPIFNELIRSNGHVSTLDIARFRSHGEYGIYTLPMPNLKTLSIDYYSYGDYQKLKGLRVNWPLEKLYLRFDTNNFIEWQRVFDVLHHSNCSETLTHLEIRMPYAFADEDKEKIKNACGSLNLNLPHLTCLKLDMNVISCLDFLLPMKNSLSILKLKVWETIKAPTQARPNNARLIDTWNKVEKGKVIKLLSCSQRPWKSNMWTLFPKLELLECEQEVTMVINNNWAEADKHESEWSRSRKEWEKEFQAKIKSSKRQK